MKKFGMAGFWLAQFGFGIVALNFWARNQPILGWLAFLASFGSTLVGGKLLGIDQELTKAANASVPWIVQKIWNLVCNVLLGLLAVDFAFDGVVGGFRVSPGFFPIVAMFYVAVAFRDAFLANFLFRKEF